MLGRSARLLLAVASLAALAVSPARRPRRSCSRSGAWIHAHLKLRDDEAYAWRNVDRMIADDVLYGADDAALRKEVDEFPR